MRFEAKDGEATLWVYDPIGEIFGPDAVTSKGVRDRLSSLRNIDRLNIRINSPGGEVDAATAIHTLISEFTGEKVVKIDGVAASAASVIAMAGDRIEMAKGSRLMIHNPWTVAIGDYRELMKAAKVAEHYRDGLVGIYSARSKKSDDVIRDIMDAETWYLPEEAIDFGIADSIGSDTAVEASSHDKIMAQVKLVAQMAFAELVAKDAGHLQQTFDSMAAAAERIAADSRQRDIEVIRRKTAVS